MSHASVKALVIVLGRTFAFHLWFHSLRLLHFQLRIRLHQVRFNSLSVFRCTLIAFVALLSVGTDALVSYDVRKACYGQFSRLPHP